MRYRKLVKEKRLSLGDIKGIKYAYGNFNCIYDAFPEEYYS